MERLINVDFDAQASMYGIQRAYGEARRVARD
jgi:hypothetical protein